LDDDIKPKAETDEAESAPDPILALVGLFKELWSDEHADDYVRRLREGWEWISPTSFV
jgi:hypothetical protein